MNGKNEILRQKTYIFVTNDRNMKKQIKKYRPSIDNTKVSEPASVYNITPKMKTKEILVKDFTYTVFKKVLDKGPFTMADWADMLFISERTLHRYAKENVGFNGLQIERILLLETLIDMGNDLFGSEGFKAWLLSKPFSIGDRVVKNSLRSHNGIQDAIDTLGRMQHGISA